MTQRSRLSTLFWKGKSEKQVIVTCVRWHSRFSLSLRDFEETHNGARRRLYLSHSENSKRKDTSRNTAVSESDVTVIIGSNPITGK